MYIEDLEGSGKVKQGEELGLQVKGVVEIRSNSVSVIRSDAKRVMVGAGARALFYPTLIYNVVRNKMQADFRWWDQVDEFILLGAVPFPSDVPRLKELGVGGVITLNEPYETLVPSSLYHDHNIDHLLIPTRDYCFAPSLSNIWQAVQFIHDNASLGKTTYVHCKAGRGRSTTVVICYLVQHKRMMPDLAYAYVKSIRPRVCLASSQWQAVQDYYYQFAVKKAFSYHQMTNLILKSPWSSNSLDLVEFDESSVVIVTESDLDGYDPNQELNGAGNEVWADLNCVYRVRVASEVAMTRISWMWLSYRAHQKITGDKFGRSIGDGSCGEISVDIHVY